jgi:hypothetical protein
MENNNNLSLGQDTHNIDRWVKSKGDETTTHYVKQLKSSRYIKGFM